MDLTQAKQFLRALKPLEALKKVAHFNSSKEPEEAPALVRIVLSGGYPLEGAPWEVAGGGQALLLGSNGDVIYFDSSAVVAVQVVSPGKVLATLTEGRFFQAPSGEAPSILALKRAFLSVQEQLSGKFGIALKGDLFTSDLTDRARYNLDRFLKSLQPAFTSVCSDSEGVAALGEIQEVGLETSEESVVMRKARELTFQLNLESDLGPFIEKLQSAIEDKI